MVAPVSDSSSPEAEADSRIPGQPALHSKPLMVFFKNNNNNNNNKKHFNVRKYQAWCSHL